MRPTGNHMDGFDFIARDFELHRLTSVDVALLDQAVAGNHNKQFPLGVMPMLAFGDTWATGDTWVTDVNGHLSAIFRVNQFRKRTAVIYIHLQGVLELLRGQIGQVQRVQLFGKRAIRHFGHHKGAGL